MNLIQLYQDYGIQYVTEGHKHTRSGWVNVSCPFCVGNPGFHLGAPIDGSYFKCWRCGWHPVDKSLAKLLGRKLAEIREITSHYGGLPTTLAKRSTVVKFGGKKLKLPSNVKPLTNGHAKYLEKRGFDPNQLIQDWGLQSTSIVSLLDGINYSKRIIYPINWNGKWVSFQTRLARQTHKDELKYLTCPMERELIHHKHILYGNPAGWQETGICVEGVTDVWRLGSAAVCTFGIEYTLRQVRELAKQFKQVVVIFDDESQAQTQADKLVAQLKYRGVHSWKLTIEGDPGGMHPNDADYLVKSIL